MPALYLLRHGQASFGTDDYDVLSDLGRQQAAVAAEELRRREVRTPVLISGTLRRQRETAQIAAGVLEAELGEPDPRLNEFDAHAMVDAHLGRAGATDGMASSQFQVHLDEAMTAWMTEPDGTWEQFSAGAVDALRDLAARLPRGADAVVATSAGVTAAIVGRLLGADAAGVIAMNRVSVNASVTTIVAGSRGLSVVTFNEHAHFLADRTLLTNR